MNHSSLLPQGPCLAARGTCIIWDLVTDSLNDQEVPLLLQSEDQEGKSCPFPHGTIFHLSIDHHEATDRQLSTREPTELQAPGAKQLGSGCPREHFQWESHSSTAQRRGGAQARGEGTAPQHSQLQPRGHTADIASAQGVMSISCRTADSQQVAYHSLHPGAWKTVLPFQCCCKTTPTSGDIKPIPREKISQSRMP